MDSYKLNLYLQYKTASTFCTFYKVQVGSHFVLRIHHFDLSR